MSKPPKSNGERFWSKVQKGSGCWLWTGALQRDGYAHFHGAGNKTISAHRYSYEIHVGPIAAGMDILHSCDVRHCVNPAHLSPGTHQDNMADKTAKGRAIATRAKLTPAQVVEIRGKYQATLSASGKRTLASNAKELAALYGVSDGAILCAVSGRTWRNLNG